MATTGSTQISPPAFELDVRCISISALSVAIDGANNLVLPAQTTEPGAEFLPPHLLLYNRLEKKLHVCRRLPLGYTTAHFQYLRCATNVVSDVVQPANLTRIELHNSRLLVNRADPDSLPDASPLRFPRLASLTLSNSHLTMREPLDAVHVLIAVGSRALFTPGATCNTLTVEFGDNSVGNQIAASYYDAYNSVQNHGSGIAQVAKLNHAERRRSVSPTASHWSRMSPVTPLEEGHDACVLCMRNNATFRFTSCNHYTICASCMPNALRRPSPGQESFIERRTCPICRAKGVPNEPPMEAMAS